MTSNNKKRISENINALAKYYGFKIKDIEEEAGVSQGYISRMSKKTTKDSNPVIDLLILASEKFHVSIDSLVSLIRTFIAYGGSGIQFNIFDASVLRDAQLHPEKYANLQVRVCGWNVRFTDLDPEAQETFIHQAETIA